MLLAHLDTIIAFAVIMLGFSLLITVMTQMFVAVTGLRGTNLKWGIEQLLSNIDPSCKDAKTRALEILHNPLISDSAFSSFASRFPRIARMVNWIKPLKIIVDRWRLGTAIRPEELAAILNMPTQSATSIENLATQIQALAPAQAADARQLAQQIIDKTRAVGGQFDLWFKAAMDRISQRFSLHTRLFTVVLAAVVAFGLHLDGLSLLKRLLSDDQLRANLVSSADAWSKQAEGVLATSSRVPTAYASAMQTLRQGSDPDAQLYADLTKNLPEPPQTFATIIDAETWLRQNLKANAQTDQVVAAYRKILSHTLVPAVAQLGDQLGEIKLMLRQSEFQLIESPYRAWDYFAHWPRNRHFWGVFGTAILLSLGAPFWFNALKSLINLRPILAEKQDKEQAAKA